MRLDGPEATEAFGRRLAAQLRAGDVVALFGELGAGKTTLARGILPASAIDGDVASPTFPIVMPYDDARASPVWHVDLYRIEDPAELEELALDEALEDGALLIEWPERLGARSVAAIRFGSPCDRRRGGRPRLDSRGAARLGSAMAAPMIPPAAAPDFLAAHGWDGAEIRPLAGDASFRRYFRVHRGGETRGADGRAAGA